LVDATFIRGVAYVNLHEEGEASFLAMYGFAEVCGNGDVK
jgi:hypothetical protein